MGWWPVMTSCQLPKRTRERLAACEAVGLWYLATTRRRGIFGPSTITRQCTWSGLTAPPAPPPCCSGRPFEAEHCAGDDEPVPYQPPGAA